MSTHAVDHIRRQTPKVVHPYRISVIHPYLLTLFKGGKAVLSQSSAWRNPNNSRRKPRPDANIKLLLDPPTAADARDDFPGHMISIMRWSTCRPTWNLAPSRGSSNSGMVCGKEKPELLPIARVSLYHSQHSSYEYSTHDYPATHIPASGHVFPTSHRSTFTSTHIQRPTRLPR